jgi:hypothetical protein
LCYYFPLFSIFVCVHGFLCLLVSSFRFTLTCDVSTDAEKEAAKQTLFEAVKEKCTVHRLHVDVLCVYVCVVVCVMYMHGYVCMCLCVCVCGWIWM